MTERKKDLLALTALLMILILFFSRILFTDMIIRAPDITNEFYWTIKDIPLMKFLDLFRINLSGVDWDIYVNSGHTAEGGFRSLSLLFYKNLIFWLFPLPSSVAWFIVLHFFFGACGLYCYCRAIGTSRLAAFAGGMIFALAPEMASLINAGHVMKIATISFAPWAFFFFEKGFLTRRIFWFLAAALVLALQFFNTHWQIAFYTCLAIGVYGLLRSLGILFSRSEKAKWSVTRLFGMNAVLLVFFLSTVSISLLPLATWSKGTNRGVESGANQGRGGLDREEAMSWSLPPEELAGLIIPGFFGLSRQEGGENPSNIRSYYWGRMFFTQTASYMGLLPWLLAPIPLIFRRDKYSWLAVTGIVAGLLFSMGKYSPFYTVLFDYLPGINRFRVPKMMMFVPLMGLAVMAARGLDSLRNPDFRASPLFRKYLCFLVCVPLLLLLLLGLEIVGRSYWIEKFYGILIQPTRYEQGAYLVLQRWQNLVYETGLAAGLASVSVFLIWAVVRRTNRSVILPLILLLLCMGDMWRINDKFMFLVKAPEKAKGIKTPVVDFLARESNQYRVFPMDGSDPMYYVSNKIPVLFTSNPVQQKRWQDYLDGFSLSSAMSDMLNVKYLVMSPRQFNEDKGNLGAKYQPAFQSPDGKELVVENRAVLPKAWLVPSALQIVDPRQMLAIMQSRQFDPRQIALVEEPPSLQLAPAGAAPAGTPGTAVVEEYDDGHIKVNAHAAANALLVLGEKYYRGWKATVDGKSVPIVPVNYVLRGVYLPPGSHAVEFLFDPLPFKIGKYLTLASFAVFAVMLAREWRSRNKVGIREL
jgi:hypothetical protein